MRKKNTIDREELAKGSVRKKKSQKTNKQSQRMTIKVNCRRGIRERRKT
jgi:hypothetical protein